MKKNIKLKKVTSFVIALMLLFSLFMTGCENKNTSSVDSSSQTTQIESNTDGAYEEETKETEENTQGNTVDATETTTQKSDKKEKTNSTEPTTNKENSSSKSNTSKSSSSSNSPSSSVKPGSSNKQSSSNNKNNSSTNSNKGKSNTNQGTSNNTSQNSSSNKQSTTQPNKKPSQSGSNSSSGSNNSNRSNNQSNNKQSTQKQGESSGYGNPTENKPDSNSNKLNIDGKIFNVGDTVTCTYYLQVPYSFIAYQAYIKYDSNCLKVEKAEMNQPAAGGSIINYEPKNRILFNGSLLSSYDYKDGGEFVTVKYKVIKGGKTSPEFIWQVLSDKNMKDSVVDGKTTKGEILTKTFKK